MDRLKRNNYLAIRQNLYNSNDKDKYKKIQLIDNKLKTENETLIYHTWNIEDKSWETQLNEYEKFKKFVTENNDKRIIFVSTSSQKESSYVKFKQLSESFLIENCHNCLVLKFPTLIGKGVIRNFKTKKQSPYGIMEIMSLKKCAALIIDNLNFKGQRKILYFDGEHLSAELVYELVNI